MSCLYLCEQTDQGWVVHAQGSGGAKPRGNYAWIPGDPDLIFRKVEQDQDGNLAVVADLDAAAADAAKVANLNDARQTLAATDPSELQTVQDLAPILQAVKTVMGSLDDGN